MKFRITFITLFFSLASQAVECPSAESMAQTGFDGFSIFNLNTHKPLSEEVLPYLINFAPSFFGAEFMLDKAAARHNFNAFCFYGGIEIYLAKEVKGIDANGAWEMKIGRYECRASPEQCAFIE